MKIMQVNSTSSGSTGSIVKSLSKYLLKNGNDVLNVYSLSDTKTNNTEVLSTDSQIKLAALCSRVTGNYGFENGRATQKIIHLIEEYQPDLIHMHNFHGHDFAMDLVFRFIKEAHIPVVITMHDEWLCTGYCPYPSKINCDKHISKCNHCPEKSYYTWFFDHSEINQKKKIEALHSLDSINLVTPSCWLMHETKKTLLKDLPIRVINNGIDIDIFKPRTSNWKKQLHLNDKKVIMSTAMSLTNNKGMKHLQWLAESLPDDYVILIVGNVDSSDIESNKIVPLGYTENKEQLAELYSLADVFVNPTLFDNFPTVNLEALACGTPVVTFASGGADEMIDDTVGAGVVTGNDEEMLKNVLHCANSKASMTDNCRTKAKLKYAQSIMAENYMRLYEEMLSKGNND